MKEGFKFFRVLKTSMQRTLRRETCIVHLSDFESKSPYELRDQSLLMVGGGAEDIKGGSPIIFLPRWGGQIKNQTARGGAMKNNQLKLTSILFRNK